MIAAMIFPRLILCKTKESKDESNSKTISRRLDDWNKGNIKDLFLEAKALNKRLPKSKLTKEINEAQHFNKLMSSGKIASAIGMLSETQSKGILALDTLID